MLALEHIAADCETYMAPKASHTDNIMLVNEFEEKKEGFRGNFVLMNPSSVIRA